VERFKPLPSGPTARSPRDRNGWNGRKPNASIATSAIDGSQCDPALTTAGTLPAARRRTAVGPVNLPVKPLPTTSPYERTLATVAGVPMRRAHPPRIAFGTAADSSVALRAAF